MAITINRCICGCSLRAGVLIWLWLSTIMVVLLIISEVDYLANGSKYPYLYWLHIIQLASVIGWTTVNILSLLSIYQKKPKWLVPFLWFSVSSIISFFVGLSLLVIFWSDILNSRFASEYLQELIIAEEARLSSADRNQLYEKIKEMIKQFGLPVIVIIGIFLLVLEMYVTVATYSLYKKMNEPVPRSEEPELLDRIISVEVKKRRSQQLAHSIKEVKPIMNVN